MKRIVTIQDISCIGKCSISVALPVISALGVETVILPTALLSTHTMFPKPAVCSLEHMIEPIAQHWKSQGFAFDAVYTGYLASEEQIRLVERFFDDFAGADTLRFVDPAMADDGRLYSGFDDQFPKAMAAFCGKADIILPNLTEGCLMTGMEYTEHPDGAFIREMLLRLADLGTRRAVVLTGVTCDCSDPAENGRHTQSAGESRELTGAAVYDIEHREVYAVSRPRIPVSYHGTGDLFASVTVGALMQGAPLQQALELAADFVAASIQETMQHDPDKKYGVDFEPVLSMLTQRVRNGGEGI